jgi:hypothetical protein|uniref:Uncharacterized protein n=1 Tax=Fagus sylvatica TaxID=28930 RepID=A0A2N9HHX4_FAGSY
MADPYNRYGAGADRASVSRPSFPGYLSSEPPSLLSHPILGSTDMLGASSDSLKKEINSLQPQPYGFDGTAGSGAVGASIKGYPSPLNDPNQRQDLTPGISSGIRDVSNEGHSSLKNVDGVTVPSRESNVLFVDKLPNNCMRREVGRILFLCNVFAC